MVIPALNEETTVASVVAAALADQPHEVLVIDADSHDATADEARSAGATVYNWTDILPEVPTRAGKGESLWRGVAAATGDIVVFLDADLVEPQTGMVSALALAFHDPGIHLVKADYQRTIDGHPTGGGRVTELTARPLLRLLYPELAHIKQPLAGEYAIRRSTALDLPFVAGYGVEAGLLVDIAAQYGAAAIGQVDLGVRRHRNRPLAELSPMADVVAATLMQRGDAEQRPALSGIL